jgi:LysM repeat protein
MQVPLPDRRATTGQVRRTDDRPETGGNHGQTAPPLASDGRSAEPDASAGVTQESAVQAYEQQQLAFEEQRRQHEIYSQVEAQVAWYMQRLSFVRQSIARAVPYLYLIISELEKSNLPLDLALLPIVESGYKPYAESSKQAAGIWQFIPSTGRIYGLKQNETYDGRFDIAASTRAAVAYLAHLKRRFKGEWALVLASYNCGEGAVERAIAKNHAAGLPTDFWSLQLPSETKAYVPRLLALSTIFANPGAYRLKLVPVPNQAYLASVRVDHKMAVETAAGLAGLGTDYFIYLNAGYIGSVVGGDGSYELLLPRQNVETFRQRLDLLQHPAELSLTSLIGSNLHVAGLGPLPGEAVKVTLASYSVDAGRHSKPFRVSDTPPAGERGAGAWSGRDAPSNAAGRSDLGGTQQGGSEAPSGKAKRHSSNKKAVQLAIVYFHDASPGETVEKVASYYNVSPSVLVTANKLKPRNRLQPGQRLTIPLDQAGPMDLLNAGGNRATEWTLRTTRSEASIMSVPVPPNRLESAVRERRDEMMGGKRCFDGRPDFADLSEPFGEGRVLLRPLRSCDSAGRNVRTASACGAFNGPSLGGLVMQ